ncbi:MAG: subtilase-type protease inhibitor [Thermoleophilia bacterium]|nr:subtilase-type protease inhibitor [Thermoleophilia bacterium]
MRLPLAALPALLAVCVLAATGAGAAGGRTALRVVYYEDAREPETRIVWTLRCDPVGGTLPRRTAACRELARTGTRTLRPVPPDRACTEIYGGPMVAIVTGTVDGRRVWAKLRRDDGCQIERWERNWFLVPGERSR